MTTEPQLQPRPIVAFQGSPGAFSHEVIELHWAGEAEPLPCGGFRGAIDALLRGEATHAVLPVDNNTIGPIHQARDAIAASPEVRIIGMVNHPIRHALMGSRGSSIASLTHVHSHPAALAQCALFLSDHPRISAMTASDTAGAASLVAARCDPTQGAIAPAAAAALYGLELLATDIQDRDDNVTSFAVIVLD
jgi:prephenate dehydratase